MINPAESTEHMISSDAFADTLKYLSCLLITIKSTSNFNQSNNSFEERKLNMKIF